MTKSFKADLHTHTTYSDGTFTPTALIQLAKEIGLKGICITDHDTVDAYDEAIVAAKQEGIWLGSGVEFSTMEKGKSVHILGYDIQIDHPRLQGLCQQHIFRRAVRNETILANLAKRGMQVELPTTSGSVGRPHIAQALVEKGYVGSIQEAFSKWIGDGCPCFAPGNPVTVEETLSVIHDAGGKAFLAHPHLLTLSVRPLLSYPFDGVECYYAKFTRDQEKKWIDLARERGLLISGGSDFHGDIKPHNPLGASWVGEDLFRQIFEKNLWC